jgi:zinc transport system substrate-binding protein
LLSLTASGAAAAPLSVFVSVLPLQTFVEKVGGDRVETRVMVQPGHSPATYDPSPQQVAALAEADLYLRVGVPFENAWMKRIRAANPDMPVLDLRDGLTLRPLEAHVHEDGLVHGGEAGDDQDHGHEHDNDNDNDNEHSDLDGSDPRRSMDAHIWTSPPLVRQMASAIRDMLTRLDPDGAAVYAERQAAFDAELAALDRDLEAILSGLERRSFLVYHPAWGYFADTYDLTQVPIEHEGKMPGARRLTALIEQARAADTRVIFVQPQFDRRAAARVAQAIGGRVETVDPLAADYADNLRRVAQLIVEANSDGSGAPTAAAN